MFGEARVSGEARVYGDAMVFGNACMHGSSIVHGGKWEKSPLYIKGSCHGLTTSSFETVSIGCKTHTVDEWLDNYREIGQENNYTDEQVEEYYDYLLLAKKQLEKMS